MHVELREQQPTPQRLQDFGARAMMFGLFIR